VPTGRIIDDWSGVLLPAWRRRGGIAVVAVLISLSAVSCSSSNASPQAQATAPSLVGPVGHVGQWLTDPWGRVIITHGFNLLWKSHPYYPPDFSTQDAQFLVQEGFNGARIGFLWAGAEPQPGHYDTTYIDHIAKMNATLGSYGIRTLVDFHQDDYSAKYGGDGAPNWASIDSNCPLPIETCTKMLQAFQNLWDNIPVGGVGLTQQFEGAWTRAAAALRGAPNVLGYDLFNEPYGGSTTGCALFSPCPSFEQGQLAQFYRNLIATIRRQDQTHLVFYEPVPQLLANPTSLPAPLSNDPKLGFTFHYYARDCGAIPQPTTPAGSVSQDLRCTPEESNGLDNGIAYATRAGAPPFLGEFGDSTNDTDNANMVDVAGARFLSWTYWEYYTTTASLSPGLLTNDSKPGSEANTSQGRLNDLVVPYPEAIAGTPGTYSFDRAQSVMHFSYSTRPIAPHLLCPGAVTEVFVPRRVYPHGYRVKVTGARVVSPPTWPWIELATLSGSRSVTVTVSPASGSTTQIPTTAIDPRSPTPRCVPRTH
jgi:endoglycosylceramidase